MQHLCLVSAQPIPNLTPALDKDFSPDKVILAVSPQMQEQAKHQEEVLKRFKVPVEQLDLPDAYDISSLLDTFIRFLDAHEGEEILLNATGGTKPMAIAAQEAFRMAGLPVFYVHDRDDKIIWLDRQKAAQDISTRMKLEPFLQAHGYTLDSCGIPGEIRKEWKSLAEEIVNFKDSDTRAVAALNAIAANAKESNKLEARLSKEAKGVLGAILHKMYDAGVVKYYDDLKVEFSSEEARFFANGGWLEIYLNGCLSRIDGLQDHTVNMNVRTGSGVKNELDGAILYRNRLVLLECKTRSYDSSSIQDITDALYKLDSLTALGGLRTSGIFISYFPLPDFILNRAKVLNIHVCHRDDIKRLPEFIKAKVISR